MRRYKQLSCSLTVNHKLVSVGDSRCQLAAAKEGAGQENLSGS